MSMSIRGKNLALTAPIVLAACFAGGCTQEEPPQEKQPVAVVAEATPVPTTAAPTEPAAAQPAATDTAGTDPYEDSLVLLAEGEPDAGPAPLTVRFTVESLVVDEIPGAKYTWNFGDGSPASSEPSPTHTYEKPGDYTATIGVVDANGEQGWDEVDIFVEEPETE